MQLEYLQPEQLRLQPNDVPKKGRWPHIYAPKWPFNAQLVSPALAYGCQLSYHGTPDLAAGVCTPHTVNATSWRAAGTISYWLHSARKQYTNAPLVRHENALASIGRNQ